MQNYLKLEIKQVSGLILNLPVNKDILSLSDLDFTQDDYVKSMKPGTIVAMDPDNNCIVPADPTNADQELLGFLVADAAGIFHQNINAKASGLMGVLCGGGNVFVSGNVVEDDIKAGDRLYLGENGQMTKEMGDNETVVAVALSANNSTNKDLIILAKI